MGSKVDIYSIKGKSKRRRRRKITGKRKGQVGGMLPLLACGPCMASAVSGVASGVASGAAALGAGSVLYAVKKRSSMKTVKGKRVIDRHEVYETFQRGKKVKRTFIQKGRNLVLNGRKSRSKNMKGACKKFNKSVKKCRESGFKKC